MLIGKWNRSVFLTYVGMIFSLSGIFLCIYKGSVRYAMCCLMAAGICDLFDGVVARKCKRTEEEKLFGIQLDSLVDVISFIALPIVIFLTMGFTRWYQLLIQGVFAVCGIARLAYFNITVEDTNSPVRYYHGMPVTYSALIFPVLYAPTLLFDNIAQSPTFTILYSFLILLVAEMEILNFRMRKPRGIAYFFFSLLAIAMLVLYMVVR